MSDLTTLSLTETEAHNLKQFASQDPSGQYLTYRILPGRMVLDLDDALVLRTSCEVVLDSWSTQESHDAARGLLARLEDWAERWADEG